MISLKNKLMLVFFIFISHIKYIYSQDVFLTPDVVEPLELIENKNYGLILGTELGDGAVKSINLVNKSTHTLMDMTFKNKVVIKIFDNVELADELFFGIIGGHEFATNKFSKGMCKLFTAGNIIVMNIEMDAVYFVILGEVEDIKLNIPDFYCLSEQ